MPVLVFSALSTTLNYKDILLTGHGTGGTEASIASVIFKEMFPDVKGGGGGAKPKTKPKTSIPIVKFVDLKAAKVRENIKKKYVKKFY